MLLVVCSRGLRVETALLVTVLLAHPAAATVKDETAHKHKRQIFREQVSPHTGGKIPDDAFRTDRLALNRLNKEGISVPDGVLLEGRHRESHHPSHRNDPSISASIVKLVQHPDGRYAPPEGHYPFNDLVESTYVIRPPWGLAQNLVIPPHRAVEVPLTIPHIPHPSGVPASRPVAAVHSTTDTDFNLDHALIDEDFLNLENQLGSLSWVDDVGLPGLPATRIWPGIGQLFHETLPARFLRETAKHSAPPPPPPPPPAPPLPQPGDYPRLTTLPRTSFSCGAARGRMVADPEASCQVFHLCHSTGGKESFLCPQGMRFDSTGSQCKDWTEVVCAPR